MMAAWKSLARRLAVCAAVQEARLRDWWESLPEAEQRLNLSGALVLAPLPGWMPP
jgi:hypothetical protein